MALADYSVDDRFETVGQQVMRLWPTSGVALQGIQIRVHHEWLDEARDMLAEIAGRPAAIRPFLTDNRWAYGIVVVLLCAIGIIPVPPTRTPSTFFLGNRSPRPVDA